jgi:membrane protease YdiL (CAAX protease family)
MLSFRAAFTYVTSRVPAHYIKTPWIYGYLSHACLLLIALGFMAVLKPFFGGNFGLQQPRPGKSYVWLAFWVGVCFGFLMLVVDYYPSLIRHSAPPGPYATNLWNVVQWLLMEGVVVGFTEEALFRGLFLGYLVSRITRSVRIGAARISVAGIIVAATFSLAHVQAFWHTSLLSALGQQLYTIAIGIFCAYLFEQSGSLLAPAIAHNAGDFVEWCCCFTMTALWHK